jgi:hypothetical protein
MPVKLLPAPDVPPHSGKEPPQRTARVEIIASGKREGYQLPHGDGCILIQGEDEGISALSVYHGAILGSG